jgi:hypothetical protein
MHRIQLLLPSDLYRRAARAAWARRISLGHLVHEALAEYLARSGGAQPAPGAIRAVLLAKPFNDPTPDSTFSVDVDHYLYGAPRRSKRPR